MNCKPGDLAIVVHPCKQQGRITRCIRLAGEADLVRYNLRDAAGRPAWVVEHEFVYSSRSAPLMLDAHIRPIRDQPGEDETLTWAPVPGERTEVPA